MNEFVVFCLGRIEVFIIGLGVLLFYCFHMELCYEE